MRRFDDECPVCGPQHVECKGGGNTRCRQRNSRASRLAGIIDTYGGIRFVVTHKRNLRHHVKSDELLFIVPNLLVHEPIAWNDIPSVVRRIEIETAKQIDAMPEPNEAWKREAIAMYRLRCLEQRTNKKSLNLDEIAQT